MSLNFCFTTDGSQRGCDAGVKTPDSNLDFDLSGVKITAS